MDEETFVRDALRNPFNRDILGRLPQLNLPEVWLASGALFQTVWNVQTGGAPDRGISDYDLSYFDPDTSWEAEDRAIKRCESLFADLGVEVELRNQARVHLWYVEKFGVPYPALTCATEGIDRFLMTCAQVGIRPLGDDYELYAPSGLDDIANMIVRPNRTANFNADHYMKKALRWKGLWPELEILPA
jgi:hypothetical protein